MKTWELVSNVPYVPKHIAFISALINFVIPGLGTCITACMAEESVSKTQLTIALFQFLTAFILIGWVCSIYWSYLIVNKSFETNQEKKPQVISQYDNIILDDNAPAVNNFQPRKGRV